MRAGTRSGRSRAGGWGGAVMSGGASGRDEEAEAEVTGVAEGKRAADRPGKGNLKAAPEIVAAPALAQHAPLAEVTPGQRASIEHKMIERARVGDKRGVAPALKLFAQVDGGQVFAREGVASGAALFVMAGGDERGGGAPDAGGGQRLVLAEPDDVRLQAAGQAGLAPGVDGAQLAAAKALGGVEEEMLQAAVAVFIDGQKESVGVIGQRAAIGGLAGKEGRGCAVEEPAKNALQTPAGQLGHIDGFGDARENGAVEREAQ